MDPFGNQGFSDNTGHWAVNGRTWNIKRIGVFLGPLIKMANIRGIYFMQQPLQDWELGGACPICTPILFRFAGSYQVLGNGKCSMATSHRIGFELPFRCSSRHCRVEIKGNCNGIPTSWMAPFPLLPSVYPYPTM